MILTLVQHIKKELQKINVSKVLRKIISNKNHFSMANTQVIKDLLVFLADHIRQQPIDHVFCMTIFRGFSQNNC